jgi:pyrroline-5-carboxylate reductase
VKATVFLGGGRITGALVAGLQLAGYAKPIVVHDRHAEKLKELKRRHGVEIEEDLRRAVDSARVLIIAVRPGSVRGLLREIGTEKILRPMIVVSLAAGVPLSKLRAHLGPEVKWARAMPSPVCRSGRGLTAVAFSRGFPAGWRAEVRDLFGMVGAVLEIPEKQFDAFTVTFSSSHGYHALAALISAAEKIGLDRKRARLAAAHALADGIAVWREGKSSLEELLEEAATPGGTAAAVMDAMNRAGYRQATVRGLRAGMKQAARNARD